jgi:hypothetical protein
LQKQISPFVLVILNHVFFVCTPGNFSIYFYTMVSILKLFSSFILLPSESQFLISPGYVHTYGSKCPRAAQSPVKFVFINPNVYFESGVILLLCLRNVYK